MGKITAKQLKTIKSKVDIKTFTIGNKEYEMKLDFNVLAELEEVYGDVEKALDDLQETKIKAIRAFVYSIVKVEDETATLKSVGAMLDMNFMTQFVTNMGELFKENMPELGEESEQGE